MVRQIMFYIFSARVDKFDLNLNSRIKKPRRINIITGFCTPVLVSCRHPLHSLCPSSLARTSPGTTKGMTRFPDL